MKRVILLLMVMSTVVFGLRAQTLTVAEGTASDSYIPVYGYYMDVPQKSQMIYPADMLTALQGTHITGLTYYLSSLPSRSWGGTQMVRVGVTSASQLNGDFNTSDVTTVWTGTLSSQISGNILSFTFDVPFPYLGGNLLIEFENPTSATFERSAFYGQDQSVQLSYMAYNVGSTQYNHGVAFLPKTTFDYTGGCFAPSRLTASDITTESVVLSWTPDPILPANSYTLAYKKISDSIYTETIVTDTFIALSGLQSSTEYEWRIRSNCSSTDLSDWQYASTFLTQQQLAQLPYLCGFEDDVESSEWGFSHSGVNQWQIGQTGARSGEYSLYISNNGTDNAYTTTSSSVACAYRDIQFDAGHPEYQISFDFKGMGQSGQDYLKVLLGPPTVLTSASIPSEFLQLGDAMSLENEWRHYSFTVDSSFAGMWRLYFLWVNNNSGGTQPPATIDNINVMGSSCFMPGQLHTNSVSDYSVLVSWSPVPGVTSDYEVAYRLSNDTSHIIITTADTFCVLPNLIPNRDYFFMVRTRCSANTYSSWSGELMFHTDIHIPDIPFFCGFEEDIENSNWQFVNSSNAKWTFGTAAYSEGNRGLYISNDNGVHNKISTGSYTSWAYRDIYIDSTYSDVMLTFDYRNAHMPANSAKVFIGSPAIPSGNTTPQNAVLLNGSLSTSINEWRTASLLIDSTHRGLQRIYFLFNNPSTSFHTDNQPYAIDNVSIANYPCSSPVELKALSMDSSDVLLSWSRPLTGEPQSYTVAYKQQDDPDFTTVTVTDTFLLITALPYSTPYVWKVRSLCDLAEQGEWSAEKLFISAPSVTYGSYCCDFEDSVENAQWRFMFDDSNAKWCIGQALHHGGNNALYVSGDDGQTNASSHNLNNATTLAYRDIYFPPTASEYMISFDSKESACEYTHLNLYAGRPISSMESSNNYAYYTSGTRAVYYFGNYFQGDTSWLHHEIIVDSSYAGMQRLYFYWQEYGYYSCPSAAAIDNICVTFTYCGRPTNLQSVATDTTATLSWRPHTNDNPESYTLAYRKASDTVFTEVLTTDTTYMLTGLQPITTYYWRLRANCSDSTSGYWSTTESFTTEQLWVGLPYNCDFEDTIENSNWQYNQFFSTSNYLYIGSAVASSGQNSLYISNDNGLTNSYTKSVSSFISFNRNIHFTPGYPQYQIAFDCKGGGTNELGFMQVKIDGRNISGYLSDADFWTRKSITIDSSYVGTRNLQLLFNYCTWLNSPGAFDNISIKGITLGIPGSLSTSDITDHEAHLSWRPDSLGTPQSYQLAYRGRDDTAYTIVALTAADTAYQLTGLESSSWYVWKVRAGYAYNEWSEWGSEKAFLTLTNLPFHCDFEDATENEFWTIRNGEDCRLDDYGGFYSYDVTNRWFIGAPADAPGNTILYISNDNGESNTYQLNSASFVWAYRDIYLDPRHSQYQLSLDFRGVGRTGNDYVRLFLDNPAVPPLNRNSTIPFVQIGEDLNLTDHWVHKSFVIDSTHAGAQRLYILWRNNINNGVNPPAAIDNIYITAISCSVPEDLTAQVFDTCATLTWSAGQYGETTSYLLAYKALTDSIYTEISLTDTQYTINGLMPMSDYIWKVRSICSVSDTSEWSSDNEFTTTQMLALLPYHCNFSNTTENDQWMMQNGSAENQWVTGGATGYEDGTALYITNDNGTSCAYSESTASTAWAYRDILFDGGHSHYQLSFDFRGIGQNNSDYMKVFVGAPSIPAGTAVPAGAVQLGGTFSNISNWTHYAFQLDSSYTGVQRIYFLWTNNNSAGTQPPAAVDNLSVIGTNCSLPTVLTAMDITDHSATLTWSPGESSSASSYTVSVRQAGQTITTEYTTADTFCIINGLPASTDYFCKVRTNCTTTAYSDWSSDFQIKTPASSPYFCDFENAQERNCWVIENGNYINKWYIGNAVNNGGNYCMYVSNDGGVSNTYSGSNSYVWAYRDIYLNPTDSLYLLSFDARSASGADYNVEAFTNIYIGPPAIPSGSTTPAGATLLQEGLAGLSQWTNKTYVIDASHSGLQRLYFLWRNGRNVVNPPIAIDNISIEGTRCSCAPSNLTVQTMDTLAILSWTMSGCTNESYTVQYKRTLDSSFSEVIASEPHIIIGNLSPQSSYVWRVRTNCTSTEHSFWSPQSTFQTTSNTARAPYFCDFENPSENSQWTILNGTFENKWYIDTAVNNGGDYSLYVSNDNGVSNTYSLNKNSVIWAYRDIYLNPDFTEYELTFDCRGYGELYNNTYTDYAKVFLGPIVSPPTSYAAHDLTPAGATQIGDNICLNSNWRNVTASIGPNFTGLQRIYILWRNDASLGSNPPAAIDNISVVPIACSKPHQVTISQVADVSAHVSWSPIYQAHFYKVAYRSSIDTTFTEISTTDNQCYLTGLSPMTTYVLKVKARCDDNAEGVWSDECTFTTTQTFATIPYYGSFEDGVDNSRWTLQNGSTSNKWFIGAAVHTDGDSALYISNNGGISNAYTSTGGSSSWAYRDVYLTPGYSNYHISFKVRSVGSSTSSYMRAFFGEPSQPSGTAQPAGTISLGGYYNNVTEWTTYGFDIDASHSGIQRIYFLWHDFVVDSWMDFTRPAAIDELVITGTDCTTPNNLSATELTSSSAHLSWSSEQGLLDPSGYYTVAYRKATDSIWYESTTHDNTLVISDLSSSSNYVWRVKSHCSANSEGFWSNGSTFSTDAEVATLPYFCGFEDADENRDWRLLNATENQWYIGQAAHQNGNYGLYVSNNQGATNDYTVYGKMSNSWAYRDIYFDPSFSEYQLSFDFRGVGQPDNDLVRVFVGTPVTVTPNNTYYITTPAQEELGNGFYSDNNWTSHSFTLDSTHAGLQRLYFLWSNNAYDGTNPPGAIDNIVIYGGTCAPPNTFSITSTTTNSISFSFNPANAEDQSWQTVIVEEGQPINDSQIVHLSSTSHTFNNLLNDTPYTIYVRTNCGDAMSAWSSISQRTDCGLITTLPYEDSFDSYGVGSNLGTGTSAFPRCWSRLSSSSSYLYPYIYSLGSYSAPGCLYFLPNNGYNVAVTPEFDGSIPLNTLQVKLKFKGFSSAASANLVVGAMTDPNDYSTFVPVDTIYLNPYAVNSWIDRIVNMATYTGQGHYIAFAQECYSSTLTPVGVDDVVIDYIPTCSQPLDVVAEAITYDSITVDWQPSGLDTIWQVVAVPSGSAPTTGLPIQVYSHPCLIGGLTENTFYDIFVKAVCGTNDESPWSVATTVKTFCAPVHELPYSENFDQYGYLVNYPDCWTFPVTFNAFPMIDMNTYGYYGMESKALVFASDPLTSPVAVTPAFDADIHSLRAQFNIAADHNYIAGCLEVGVMSNPNDITTFEPVQVFSIHEQGTWEECSVNFQYTNMTGTGRYLAFRQVGSHDDWEIWLDNLRVFQAPECDAPNCLNVTASSTNSTTVTFRPAGPSDSQWEYVVCTGNTSPNTTSSTSISDTTFVISNLLEGETYHIYVRTVCASDAYSGWSEPLTITTDCGIIEQLPYSETFDTYGTDSETAFPDCWRRLINTASYLYYPAITSEESASGVGSLKFFTNEFSDGWAIAPALAPNLSLDSIQIDFKYFMLYGSEHGWDTLLVGVMSNPYDACTYVPVDTITIQNFGVWESKSVLFDNYQGLGRYVAFRYRCPAYMGVAYIDDVEIIVRQDIGLPDYNVDSQLSLYPNPTSGQFTIYDAQGLMDNVEVYDLYGKLILRTQINDFTAVVDLSSKASGLYIVRVFTDHGIITKRVVKR